MESEIMLNNIIHYPKPGCANPRMLKNDNFYKNLLECGSTAAFISAYPASTGSQWVRKGLISIVYAGRSWVEIRYFPFFVTPAVGELDQPGQEAQPVAEMENGKCGWQQR